MKRSEARAAFGDDRVLCVNNLASRPQATTIRVPDEFRGAHLEDLFGGARQGKVDFRGGGRGQDETAVRPAQRLLIF